MREGWGVAWGSPRPAFFLVPCLTTPCLLLTTPCLSFEGEVIILNAVMSVGRVGALAVALGVGMGISSNVTLATADVTGDSTTSANDAAKPVHRGGLAGRRAPAKVTQPSPIVSAQDDTASTRARAGGVAALPAAARTAAANLNSARPNSAIPPGTTALANSPTVADVVEKITAPGPAAIPAMTPATGDLAVAGSPLPAAATPVLLAAAQVVTVAAEVARTSSGASPKPVSPAAAVAAAPVMTAATALAGTAMAALTDPSSPAALPNAPLLFTVLAWARKEFNLGSASPAATTTTSQPANPLGPRHVVSGGELFLGGNYIELGLSSEGSFGTLTGRPSGFVGGTPPGSNPDSIGFTFDVDGFGSGQDKALDFYVPDTPEERWSVGFANNNHAGFSALNEDLSNVGGLTGVSVTDGSGGNTLKGQFTAVVDDALKVDQVHTFGVNDKYYKTTVTLTNVSGVAQQNVQYMRSFDPDGTRSVGGDNTTVNTILGQFATDTFSSVTAASLEGDAYQVQTGTRAVTYYYSSDPRAVVYTGGFANPNPYEFADANQPTKYATTADDAIGIIFKVGNLAPGASATFSYYTGATTDANPIVIEEETGARPIKTIASTNAFITKFNSVLQSENYKQWMDVAGIYASVIGVKAISTALNFIGTATKVYQGDLFGASMNAVRAAGNGLMALGAKNKIGFLYAAGAAVSTIGYVADLAAKTDWSDPGGTVRYAISHPVETAVEFGKATVVVGGEVLGTIAGSFGGFLGIAR